MAKLRIFLAILLASCSLLATPLSTYAATSSDPLRAACNTTKAAQDSPLCKQAKSQDTNDPIAGTNGIISKATNIVAIVAALGAVINIVIGAFEFVTAGGTGFKNVSANPAPTKAAKARSRVTSGLIGLAIVALAWAILRFVEDRVIR